MLNLFEHFFFFKKKKSDPKQTNSIEKFEKLQVGKSTLFYNFYTFLELHNLTLFYSSFPQKYQIHWGRKRKAIDPKGLVNAFLCKSDLC